MTTMSTPAPRMAVTWVVKSVSLTLVFWMVAMFRPMALMASWKMPVSETLKASSWA